MKKIVIVTMAFVLAFGISACKHNTKLYKPVTVDHRGEAGAVLLSVNSTIPWSDAAPMLDPGFSMKTGDDALGKVIRSTAVMRQQVLDAFGVGLGAGLPTTSSSQITTMTTNQKIGNEENQTITEDINTVETSKKEPGIAPAAPSPTPASKDLPQQPTGENTVGVNPHMEYKAAQSLYHAVKLLNEEARNAAVRNGYVPHVIMLKLTPMLYRRDLSYDIHAKVSFFNTTAVVPTRGCPGDQPERLPYVVPILATDDLERSIRSNAVEISRQIGLSLNAMVKGVGANAALDRINQQLNEIVANDFNSILTVGRLTDNSLYIRLGSANQASSQFSIVGKSYDIATLVLVPVEYYKKKGAGTTLGIISHTELRESHTGKILDRRSDGDFLKELDDAFRSVLQTGSDMDKNWAALEPEKKHNIAKSLSKGIQTNNWNTFEEEALKIELGEKSLSCIGQGYLQTLWTRLAGLMRDGVYKSASVELRPSTPLKIPSQTIVLRDYGENGMEAVLYNVTGARTGGLTATLEYASGEVFPAEEMTIIHDTKLLRLKFPSPQKWKLAPSGCRIKITPEECNWCKIAPEECNCCNACPAHDLQDNGYPSRYLSDAPKLPEPNLSLRQTLKVIVTDKSKGGVTLFIDKLKDDAVDLSVEGARISGARDSETKKTVTVKKQQVRLFTDSGLDLDLDNLRPGVGVAVKATGLKQHPKTKQFEPTGVKQVDFDVVKAE